MAAAHIQGIQDNPAVESVIKHYVGNEQEIDRTTSSSNVDEQTLREIYTLPFQIAIQEGDPGGIMCAFNQVNHVYSCENASILADILKDEIGFDGWVVTDFGPIDSLNSTPNSLVAGLDQELNRRVSGTRPCSQRDRGRSHHRGRYRRGRLPRRPRPHRERAVRRPRSRRRGARRHDP